MACLSPLRIKLADFGISKSTQGTSLRSHVGTLCYQAPEQFGFLAQLRIGSSYTTGVDIWALGVIVHQILTSEIPFLQKYERLDSLISSLEQVGAESSPTINFDQLYQYCQDSKFPSEVLRKAGASSVEINFIKRLMAVNPKDRDTAAAALESAWFFGPEHLANQSELLYHQFDLLGAPVTSDTSRQLITETDRTVITNILRFPLATDVPLLQRTAASRGYLEALKILLVVTDDPSSYPGTDNFSLLLFAAGGNLIAVMKILMNRGVDIHDTSASQTAIHAAAAGGHLDAINLLLDSGGNVNNYARTDRSQTALHAAAAGGHLDAVTLLLDRGAMVNSSSPNKHGQSPLQAAAAGGHTDTVKRLLDRGAFLNWYARTEMGQTALYAAAAGGHLDVIKLLLKEGANVHSYALTANGQLPLHAAAASGHVGAIALLLDRGASVKGYVPTEHGQFALYAAAAGGHCNAIALLLNRGAHVNLYAPTENGQLALHAAAAGGHCEAIALLLKRGAYVRAFVPTKHGQTALHAAAGGGHLDAIRLLLRKGADVNSYATTANGQLALHAAAAGGHVDVITLLLTWGADLSLYRVTNNRQPALQAAIEGGHHDAIRLIMARGSLLNPYTIEGVLVLMGQPPHGLQTIARDGYIRAVRVMFSMGARVNIEYLLKTRALSIGKSIACSIIYSSLKLANSQHTDYFVIIRYSIVAVSAFWLAMLVLGRGCNCESLSREL